MNGNRHDLPSSPVRLLHTGYAPEAVSHGPLAHDLDLDRGPHALPEGARERADGRLIVRPLRPITLPASSSEQLTSMSAPSSPSVTSRETAASSSTSPQTMYSTRSATRSEGQLPLELLDSGTLDGSHQDTYSAS